MAAADLPIRKCMPMHIFAPPGFSFAAVDEHRQDAFAPYEAFGILANRYECSMQMPAATFFSWRNRSVFKHDEIGPKGVEMDPKEEAKRLFDAVQRERKRLGWGRSRQLDRRLQRSEGHVSRLLSGKRAMRVQQLFELIGALNFEPGEFFASVYGAEYRMLPENVLLRLEEREKQPDLLRRVDALLLRQSTDSTPTVTEQDRQEPALNECKRIDELRFSFPLRAREEGRQLLTRIVDEQEDCGNVEVTLLCATLAPLGSVERILNNFPLAAAYLRRALTIAQEHCLLATEADLLQRCCYLVADQGELSLALSLASQAGEKYTLLHDLPGLGKTLVDRGIMFDRLGESNHAIQHYVNSLSYMPPALWQWRYAAFIGLGFVYLEIGKIEQAERYAQHAYKEHRTREGLNWEKREWLRGEIAIRKGELRHAEAAFRHVRNTLAAAHSHVECALVSLRLSKVYLMTNRLDEMFRLASDMMQLLEPLRKENKIARGAVNDFITEALAGKVTTDFLDHAHDRIQEATKRSGQLPD